MTGNDAVLQSSVLPLATAVLAAMRLAVVAAALTVLAAATLPVVIGMRPVVVMSGSMAPAVAVGDVVLYARVSREALHAGQVLVMDDPVRPGGLLTHRLVQVDDSGLLRTKGDANAAPDSTLVDIGAVRGAVRLRVPFAGLPAVWLRSGRPAPLAAMLAVGLLLAAPDVRRRSGAPVHRPPSKAPDGPRTGRGGGRRHG